MTKSSNTPPPNSAEVQITTTTKQKPSDPGNAAKLPHERDQSVNMTDGEPSPEMKQAHKDIERGLVDTDARGSDGKPLGSKKPTS